MWCGSASLQRRSNTDDVLLKPTFKSGHVDYRLIGAALEHERVSIGKAEVLELGSEEGLLILQLVFCPATMDTVESAEKPSAEEARIRERRDNERFGSRREECASLVPLSGVEFRDKEPSGWRRRRVVGHLKEARHAQRKFCRDVNHCRLCEMR